MGVAAPLDGLGLGEVMQAAPPWRQLIAADGRSPLGPMLLLPPADVGHWKHRARRPPVAEVESARRTRTSGAAGDVARTTVVEGGESSSSSPVPRGLVPSSDLCPPMP
jgi:hypothetical protein